MAGGEPAGRSLALTPTWAIATICTVMVVFSFLVERTIHRLGLWLKRRKQKAWSEALERMKEELMLLGFISLAITVSQTYIVQICLPNNVLKRFTPCNPSHPGTGPICKSSEAPPAPTRRLLEYGLSRFIQGRTLAATTVEGAVGTNPCQGQCAEGHQPMISAEGISQLHEFVFVLAIIHVLFSALTMALSMLKVHTWKKWEQQAQAENIDPQAEITKTLIRQSTFVRYHTSSIWSNNSLLLWIRCFFRQFFASVEKVDYLALRLGFLTNHHFAGNFNFHRYMVRSIEAEFKKVVGISAYFWVFVVGFLLFNVEGTNVFFWAAIVPAIMLLLVGTKLHHVIATLALENAKLPGSQRVRPRDELFWLNSPELLLGLIHFVLFQNAFELATFFWTWWQFSLSSCFLEDKTFNVIRLSLGFLVQMVSSYSTLPLYALVSQMGSHYKLNHDLKKALHDWGRRAKHKSVASSAQGMSPSSSPLQSTSIDTHGHSVVELQEVPKAGETTNSS